MQPDRLQRVCGAAWIVAAAWWKQRAYDETIPAQQADQRRPGHRLDGDVHGFSHNFSQSASAARRTWAISIRRPSPWPATTMTMSQFGSLPRARRNDSRTWRLARLRSVARRNTFRGATIPSRGTRILFRAARRRNGPLRRRRRGLRKTRSNSGLRVSRTPAGNRLPTTDGTGTASPFLSTHMIGSASSGYNGDRQVTPVLERVSSRC